MIQRLLEKYTTNEIAEHLYVAKGTVKRWIDTSTIPDAYTFDIMKLLGDTIDYSLYNFNTKDQFYTPISTALHCYSRTCEILKKLGEDETQYTYIEPSAGSGNFLNALPSDRTIALDVEPRNSISIAGAARVINKQDYMDWSPKSDDKKYIVIGNPPFGLRGNLALRFINHSYEFADFVCFILPQLFESDGKGVPRRRVVGYNLIHSEKIPSTFYYQGNMRQHDIPNMVKI